MFITRIDLYLVSFYQSVVNEFKYFYREEVSDVEVIVGDHNWDIESDTDVSSNESVAQVSIS